MGLGELGREARRAGARRGEAGWGATRHGSAPSAVAKAPVVVPRGRRAASRCVALRHNTTTFVTATPLSVLFLFLFLFLGIGAHSGTTATVVVTHGTLDNEIFVTVANVGDSHAYLYTGAQVHSPHATPRHATPRHATPRHATPRHATPRHATPRHATPRPATPRHGISRRTAPHSTRRAASTLTTGAMRTRQNANGYAQRGARSPETTPRVRW